MSSRTSYDRDGFIDHFHYSKAQRRAFEIAERKAGNARLHKRNRKIQRWTRNAFHPRGLVKVVA